MTVYNVDATELIEELAKELQKTEHIKPPAWAMIVKTGASRERPPAREDWWYVRAASVLRKVRLLGPIGVSKLRTLYGGKKNRGHKPEQFRRSSGNILRKVLQQLEAAELVKKDKKGVHQGRLITPNGIKLIDNVAKKIIGSKPKEAPKPKEEKKEVKATKEEPKEEKQPEKKEETKKEAKTETKPKEQKQPEKKEQKPKEQKQAEKKPEVKAEKPKEEPAKDPKKNG